MVICLVGICIIILIFNLLVVNSNYNYTMYNQYYEIKEKYSYCVSFVSPFIALSLGLNLIMIVLALTL